MEKLILINLNQMVNRAQLLEMRKDRWRWVVFGILALLFFGFGYSFYTIQRDMEDLINKREERIVDVKNQIASLKAKADIDLSKKDVESLYDLEEKRIVWALKLMALSEITPDDMAITEVAYSDAAGNGRLLLSGISHLQAEDKEFTVVEEFIDLLKQHTDFANDFKYIRFISSNRHLFRGQEILQFKVESRQRKPRMKRTRAEIIEDSEMGVE